MNPTQLYLDTARLGRMSGRAQQAQLDFTRMAGEQGASLFFERFLQDGSDSWPSSARSRFPGLTGWRGVTALKQSLRTLAGSNPALPVLTVNRSAQLMKFAARLLYRQCGNVLVTDLGWPPYHKILETEAARARRVVTTLAVRELMCNGQATEDQLVEAVRSRFVQSDCDGLFLTAVSNLGFRLPVERLVRALEAARELRFVVIDGAQDFCHVSADLGNEYCDLYLASCHKWLQGFHPMGLGFYGRHRSRSMIETAAPPAAFAGANSMTRCCGSRHSWKSAALDGETETVNLIPLFTSQGAAADALERPSPPPKLLGVRHKNLAQATAVAESCGWRSLLPAEPFRTGILLLQAESEATRSRPADALRGAFAEHGIALTAYEGGSIRLSMPAAEWKPEDIDRLGGALQAVA